MHLGHDLLGMSVHPFLVDAVQVPGQSPGVDGMAIEYLEPPLHLELLQLGAVYQELLQENTTCVVRETVDSKGGLWRVWDRYRGLSLVQALGKTTVPH